MQDYLDTVITMISMLLKVTHFTVAFYPSAAHDGGSSSPCWTGSMNKFVNVRSLKRSYIGVSD